MKRMILSVVLLLVSAIIFAAEPLKIGFVYIGPTGDAGWSYAHDQGRLVLEKAFGNQILTSYSESVPEGMESLSVIESYVKRGYSAIFTTSFGYMDPTFIAAEKFPLTQFFHCSGYKTAANMTAYFGRIEEPSFLSGIVAGEMTVNNKIGYVAPLPIPEVIRIANAFALGVKKVNPLAKIYVLWINSWYNPAKEAEAALTLIDQKCDVIAQQTDSAAPAQVAERNQVWAIGYNTDMLPYAPTKMLTSAIWDWGVYYLQVVSEMLKGTYTHQNYWGGLKDGIVQLTPISEKVPEEVRTTVQVFKDAILNSTFNPFQGPISNQKGVLMIPKGTIASDADLLSMMWFVDNVVGTIPSGE